MSRKHATHWKLAFGIGIGAILSVMAGWAINHKTNPLVLPDADKISAIRIEQIHNGRRLGLMQITAAQDIHMVLNSCKDSHKTRKESIQDAPNQQDYVQIQIAGPTTRTLYCYKDNDQSYVEEPYSGIYTTNHDISGILAKLCAANGNMNITYHAIPLWNARTPFIGNNSAVGNLIGCLPVPKELQYDHFELQTASRPYKIDMVYLVSAEVLATYDTKDPSAANPLKANALLLLALIENVDEIQTTLTDGSRKISFIKEREWAERIVDGDVRDYAKSPKTLQILIDFIGMRSAAKPNSVEYSIVKLDKTKEILRKDSDEIQQLAEAAIMDSILKSGLWEGVDITTLKECYRIRQTFPAAWEIHDYYAYRLKDGTAVLQSDARGRYSTLREQLYEELVNSLR